MHETITLSFKVLEALNLFYITDLETGLRGQGASTIKIMTELMSYFFFSHWLCLSAKAADNSKIIKISLKEYKHKKSNYSNLANI